tara:strand:+ start:6351 stop:7811 length:1461 start_codon:yes stop_codon:yes gene_type:complete
MKLIEENPFRILGVISNASAKETDESEVKIIRYLDVGKTASLKFDISPPLKLINRTQNLVIQAKNKIHDDFEKLSHSIFWFVNSSMVDKIALDKLSSDKNIEKALDTFRKGSDSFVISKKSFSSIINFSSLEIINYSFHKDKERIKRSIRHKYEIINNEDVFVEFEKIVTSKERKISRIDFKNKFVENTKLLFKELFPRSNQYNLLLDVFSDDQTLVKEIETNSVNDLINEINLEIISFNDFFNLNKSKSKSQILNLKTKILKKGSDLVNSTKPKLNKLKSIVGKSNFQYTSQVDLVYGCLNASVILLYNIESGILYESMDIGPHAAILVLKKTNFKKYVTILDEAKMDLISVNCKIKSLIIKNLQVIRKNHTDLEKNKSELRRRERQSTYNTNYYNNSGTSTNSDCFVATATMNNNNHPIVVDLRKFRDQFLLQNKYGRIFIKLYYFFGPYLAKLISSSVLLRKISLMILISPLHNIIKNKFLNK